MYSYFHALRFTISIEDNNNTKCMSNRRLDFQNSPSSDFVARGRLLRGQTRLAPLTKRSTCSKSTRQKPPSEARLMLERKHRVSTKVKAMRSYWIRLLFTLKNDDFGAISETERSCAVPISKVDRHISDWFCATLWCNVDRYSHRNGSE